MGGPAGQKPKQHDWEAIEFEYVTAAEPIGLRALARRHHASKDVVSKHASAGKWVEKRARWQREQYEKALEGAGVDRQVALEAMAASTCDSLKSLRGELDATLKDIIEGREQSFMSPQVRAQALASLATAYHTAIRTENLVSGRPTEIAGEVDPWKRVLRECGIRQGNGDGRDDDRRGLAALVPQGGD